ncbi:MAG: SAM-dependent methyltransferase, partial [Cyclobacteriaceae bacterium]|nr:SAM-dependent methyltransferase [Cyclobacteriaceae bacterium]
MIDFTQRSTQKEWMDDLECEGEVLEQTLKELKTINRWLGGNHVTTDGIQKL